MSEQADFSQFEIDPNLEGKLASLHAYADAKGYQEICRVILLVYPEMAPLLAVLKQGRALGQEDLKAYQFREQKTLLDPIISFLIQPKRCVRTALGVLSGLVVGDSDERILRAFEDNCRYYHINPDGLPTSLFADMYVMYDLEDIVFHNSEDSFGLYVGEKDHVRQFLAMGPAQQQNVIFSYFELFSRLIGGDDVFSFAEKKLAAPLDR